MMERHFDIPQGATPIADCSHLIPAWVHNSHDLNRVEAENILKAQKKHLKSSHPKNWFYPEKLKAIHQDMFKDVWNWAGIYRKSITSIGIKPILIPMRLAELCFEVNLWWENPPQLTFTEMAARIHHQLVSIHPFENGNGRFSRLVADRFLLSWKCPYPLWPQHLNQEGVKRKDYIHSLKLADKGDYSSLVMLMKQLGALDPKLSELMRDNFYHPLMNNGGIFIIKAMIENGANPNDETHNGHRVLQLAIKVESEVDEKRQLLGLTFRNLQLKDENLLVSVREPFLTMLDFKNRPEEWGRLDSNQRRPKSRDLQSYVLLKITITHKLYNHNINVLQFLVDCHLWGLLSLFAVKCPAIVPRPKEPLKNSKGAYQTQNPQYCT